MCSPAQATDNVAGITFRGNERQIERSAADCVKYDVKPIVVRQLRHIVLDGSGAIVNGNGPEGFRDAFLGRRDCREDLGVVGARKLNSNVTYAAAATENKH